MMVTPVSKTPNWRYLRNLLLAAIAMLLVAFYLIIPAYMASRAIHPERFPIGSLTPMDVALNYEDVALTTVDGIRLSGWYVPAKNGAAVIAVHAYNGNRTGVIYHAKMLADHGYGVLLFDLRAHGESGGDVFAFGWDADKDISAALAYLQNRTDVDPNRIGALGLSIGAEVVLQAAANTDEIKAVVAEKIVSEKNVVRGDYTKPSEIKESPAIDYEDLKHQHGTPREEIYEDLPFFDEFRAL